MKKILITGSTGFIGQHCLPLLLERGYEVHAVSSRNSIDKWNNIYWHRVDLLDSEQTSVLIAEVRPTHLLHFAWFTVPGKYLDSFANLHWVRASLNLVETFASYGGERVVIAGTCFEYDWRYGYCSEQCTPFAPASLYGVCKHSLQSILDAFIRQTRLSAAWGRIFFLYGPHEHPNRLVSSVIRALLKGELARCSHGNQIRDFLYVKDVAGAFIALLESNISGAVNVASGHPVTIKDVIMKIAGKLGRKNLIQLGALPVSENEPHLLVADVNQLTQKVGWAPKYDLDRGLDQTIAWWRKHLIAEEHEPTK